MNNFKLLIALFLVSIVVQADQFYKMVGYECNEEKKSIILTYQGALNEAGENIIAKKNNNQWDLDLFIFNTTGKPNVQRECQIDNETYTISIGAILGNPNPHGRCGAWRTAWASIESQGKSYLQHHAFEQDCLIEDTPITTKIIFNTTYKTMKFEEKSSNEFYK